MTDYDAIAEEWLPCTDFNCPPEDPDVGAHCSGCPAHYRLVIAQRMRDLVAEKDKEIAEKCRSLGN